jgi:hypothetical protein
MSEPQEIFDLLAAPFPVDDISWRVGPTNERSRQPDQALRGQALAYIDARVVMDRLDSVVGFDGWQCTYTPGVATSIVCNIGIKFPLIINGQNVGHEWIWKADGAGPSDMEADKGALSDAFKRAGVRWGIGRYLYDLKAPWIELEKRGNTAFIKADDYPKLNQLHDDFAKRSGWGDGAGIAAYRILVAEVETLTGASREGFARTHEGKIAQLPPAMRRHLLTKLERAA